MGEGTSRGAACPFAPLAGRRCRQADERQVPADDAAAQQRSRRPPVAILKQSVPSTAAPPYRKCAFGLTLPSTATAPLSIPREEVHAASEDRREPLQAEIRELHRRRMARTRCRPLFRQHDADHRRHALRGRAFGRRRHRDRPRRGARRKGEMGPDLDDGAVEHSDEDRRPHGGQSGASGTGGNLGQRQADPRDDGRRHSAGDRSFPLFRGLHPCTGRLDRRDRPRHRRLPFPRAARRRRPDHSLELPDPDGRLEACAGACRRKLRRAEAGRADAGLDPRLGGTHR